MASIITARGTLEGQMSSGAVTPSIIAEETEHGVIITIKSKDGTQQVELNDGAGIANVVLNADYTLTITTTDGESYTTPSIRGERGEQGLPGSKGEQGEPGNDGYSPTVDVTDIPDGHTVTITDVTGETSFDVMDGAQGAQGRQGDRGHSVIMIDSGWMTPTIDGVKYTYGVRVSKIEEQTGVTPVVGDVLLNRGLMVPIQVIGASGSNLWACSMESYSVVGPQGAQGIQGVSPTVQITAITGGHRVAITDAEGTQTADVMDGVDGMTQQEIQDLVTDTIEDVGYAESHSY